MGEDGLPESDEIVAMFRAKREAKARAAQQSAHQPVAAAATANEPAPPPMATPPDDDEEPSLSPAAPPPAPGSERWWELGAQAPGSAATPAGHAAPAVEAAPARTPMATGGGPASALALPHAGRELASSRVPATAAGQSLSPLGPMMNLSARLAEDRNVAVRGSRWGRRAALALVALGLLGLAVERRALLAGAVQAADRAWRLPAAAVALGIVLLALFTFVPTKRRIRLRMAETQRKEWSQLQRKAKAIRLQSRLGLALAFAGLASLVAAYALPFAPTAVTPRYALLGLGAVLVAVGGLLAAIAAARHGAHQRLYVQTMLLARLEGMGLGPAGQADPRLAPVLKALDALLGSLPESSVRRFLQTAEAQDFLDLIDESGADGGR